jgi:hypothetical protein
LKQAYVNKLDQVNYDNFGGATYEGKPQTSEQEYGWEAKVRDNNTSDWQTGSCNVAEGIVISETRVSVEMTKNDDWFDDGFPDGVFAIPRNPKEPRVKVRALFDYCEARGMTPEDLTEEEMEQFLER